MAQLIQARNDSHIISPGHAPNAPLIQASAPPPIQYRVTGDDPNVRPDDRSVWNPQTNLWERGTAALANQNARLADERKFTEAQRREAEQLNAVYERARKSGRYTPDELGQIRTQIENRKAGIQPLSQLPQPSAQEQFDQRVVTAGGRQGYINSKGDFVPFESGAISIADYGRIRERAAKTPVGLDAEGKPVMPNRQQINEAVNAEIQDYNAYLESLKPKPTEEPGVTDVSNSPRGTGTITTADGRTVSTSDLRRGTGTITTADGQRLTLNQDGSITTSSPPGDAAIPQPSPARSPSGESFIQMLKSAVPQATLPSDSVDAGEMGGGEDRPRQKRGLILLDQGKNVPPPQPQGGGDSEPRDTSHWEVGGGGNDGGGEESAPPSKKEKKDAE